MSEEKKVEKEGPRPWNGFQDDKQPLTDHRIWEIADLVWRRKSITTDRAFELDFAHEVIAAALHEVCAASTSANGDRFDPYRLKVAEECCERLMSACTDAGCPDGVRMDDWIRENIRSTSANVAQGAENTDDIAVDSFARAMKEKMAAARAKGRSGWEGCEPADLSRMLREHIEKGDPRDVANFCMMLWHHSAPIAPPAPPALTDAAIEAGWHQTFSTNNPYCPCNLKSFTKAVQWAERALTAAQSGVKS